MPLIHIFYKVIHILIVVHKYPVKLNPNHFYILFAFILKMCYNINMTNLDIIKTLKDSKSICIIGHIDPDADALASLTVLKNFLTTQFQIPIVDIFAQTEQVQENCEFMLKGQILNPEMETYDTAIAVDSPNIDRLGIYAHLFSKATSTYVIDHHNTNLKFATYNIVEESSSTSEIIFELLESLNYNFTYQDNINIYSAIITDTNNFTTQNTKKSTFYVASKIIEKINFIDIYNNFFSNISINNAKLLSFAIKNLISLKNNEILISYLSKKHFKKSNATVNDITGIVNKLSNINGNKLTCLIFKKNKEYYVSLRAKNGYNVADLAKKYKGGGHVGASGFLTKLKLNKIIKLIKKEYLNILEH